MPPRLDEDNAIRLLALLSAVIEASVYNPETQEWIGGGEGGGNLVNALEGKGVPTGVVEKPEGWLYLDKENGGLYASAIFVWVANRPYVEGELAHDEGKTWKSLVAQPEGGEEAPHEDPDQWVEAEGEPPESTENWVAVGGSGPGEGVLGVNTLGGSTSVIGANELVLQLLNGLGLTISPVTGLMSTTTMAIEPAAGAPDEIGLVINNRNSEEAALEVNAGPSGDTNLFYVASHGVFLVEATPTGEYTMKLVCRTLGEFGAGADLIGGLLSISQAVDEEGRTAYVFTVEAGGGITVWDHEVENEEAEHRLWWITAVGYEAAKALPPPEAADIADSQAFSFYDATPGSARFSRIGKDEAGNVVQTNADMVPVDELPEHGLTDFVESAAGEPLTIQVPAPHVTATSTIQVTIESGGPGEVLVYGGVVAREPGEGFTVLTGPLVPTQQVRVNWSITN